MTEEKNIRPAIAIVVPCFNEEAVLAATAERLLASLDALIERQEAAENSFLLFVDDGSTDATWPICHDLATRHSRIAAISLSRNEGLQVALLAGMEVAADTADAVITIDADLQDDIAVIPEMVRLFSEGAHIVYGVRDDRSADTPSKRRTASSFYRLQHALGIKTLKNHADFRLLSREAITRLGQFGERNMFIRGIIPMLGLPTAQVSYARLPRLAGHSKFSTMRMVNLAIDGITSFSIRPMRVLTILGLLFLVIALGMAVYVVVALLLERTIPGWSSLMLSLWFIGGCITIGLGIIGEYIGRIYIEVKHRPRYFINHRTGL